jgi:FHA domain
MAQMIVRSMDKGSQVIELKPGSNRFGRSAANDHPFDDPAISEAHCEVIVDEDYIYVRDLGSTNGTFIDRRPVTEAVLYVGQTLQIGPLEMMLEAPEARLSVPELAKPENPFEFSSEQLEDGYAACLNHSARHAVWDCPHCGKVFCDECISKVRRIGGVHLRLCPACSTPCNLSAWSESVRKRKKSLFAALADKVKSSFKRTTQMFKLPPAQPKAQQKRRTRRR